MKFYEIIRKYEFDQVWPKLIEQYPNEQIDDYAAVFEYLRYAKPRSADWSIKISLVHEDDDHYYDVYGVCAATEDDLIQGYKKGDEVAYALGFSDWDKWLGSEICPETADQYSELDILVHCLFELSFYGFDQEDIREQLNIIKNRLNSLRDNE